MADPVRPSLSQLAEEFNSLIPLADNLRLAGLAKLEAVNRSRGAALIRQLALEQARSPEDPGPVQQATARLVRQVERQANLGTVRQAAELGQAIEPGQVSVLGRVLDQQGRPAAGLRVFLSDEKGIGNPLQESPVEPSGFYRIGVASDQFESYFNGSKEIVVSVTDDQRQILAQLRRPFRAEGGAIRVFNFVLPPPSEQPQPAKSLQDIRGLGERRVQILKEQGIETLAQLAALQPKRLARLLRISRPQAEDILKQARELSRD